MSHKKTDFKPGDKVIVNGYVFHDGRTGVVVGRDPDELDFLLVDLDNPQNDNDLRFPFYSDELELDIVENFNDLLNKYYGLSEST